MDRISRIEGVAAALMVANISTDVICPSAGMASPKADFAKALFGPWRYDTQGHDVPDFVLNRPRLRGASILVTGENFGCGSSREQAVWCLARYGMRCVIAPSFGEIFFENAFKNGLVAIALPAAAIAALAGAIETEPELLVDLEARVIRSAGGATWRFAIDEYRRAALLEGLEEIDMILRDEPLIAEHQEQTLRERPWLVRARL